MNVSGLIELLQRFEDEHGDLPVETPNGTEVFALASVFEEGKKDPEVIAAKIQ